MKENDIHIIACSKNGKLTKKDEQTILDLLEKFKKKESEETTTQIPTGGLNSDGTIKG